MTGAPVSGAHNLLIDRPEDAAPLTIEHLDTLQVAGLQDGVTGSPCSICSSMRRSPIQAEPRKRW